jgi:hypothetical protein
MAAFRMAGAFSALLIWRMLTGMTDVLKVRLQHQTGCDLRLVGDVEQGFGVAN